MNGYSRRQFLANVGQGMLVASVGATAAIDLGLATAQAEEQAGRLHFGELEPLVCLMQDTAASKLLPQLVEKLKAGEELRTLVAAAALANARTFGGQDYIGYHSFMALGPALAMSHELPADKKALPVLKVLYRNSDRIQAVGGASHETLLPIIAAELPQEPVSGETLQQAVRSADFKSAENTFANLARRPAGEAFNHLQYALDDEVDVHRVVLAWRAWSALELAGEQNAHTLLRQSVRYCVDVEQRMKSRGRAPSPIRALLPKLLDQYKLLGRDFGTRRADDAWLAKTSAFIAQSTPAEAAEAAAAALAEGFAPDDIGQAICLAANELVLRDPGRPQSASSAEKPAGSVHGDSVGVHASDAANAWRNIAGVSNQRNSAASLIVGAFHTAGQDGRLNRELLPSPDQLQAVKATEQTPALAELEAAVRAKDQRAACAVAARYAQLGFESRPIFDLLLRFATSEDGALHAEKYYRTAVEEYARTRPVFRWRHLAALARVTASEFGRPAPGYVLACDLLHV